MSDKKITELNNITSANLSDVDEFVVVDISGDETKAITYGELKQFNGAISSDGLTVNGAISSDGLTVNGDITATGGDLNLDTLELNAIAATKAVTAVDVFVYDTSKDSDGGAWRKRTQSTSWYNEPLNTTTRGSRREFPAVAVIVAEANKVTIYDGDDPSLPMWMVFLASGSASDPWFLPPGGGVTSVSAKNGVIPVGINQNGLSFYGHLRVASFASDKMTLWMGNYNRHVERDFGISLRNDDVVGWSQTSTLGGSQPGIVSGSINDVAMTVLPDAPIDAATGLPIPTIAVATDGGTSVIKDDGTVVDILGAGNKTYAVTSDGNTGFIGYVGTSTSYYSYIYHVPVIPSADIANLVTDPNVLAYYEYTINNTSAIVPSAKSEVVCPKLGSIITGHDGGNVLEDLGVTVLSQGSLTDETKWMAARIRHNYATGYLPINTKGAFLSDTDTTSLVVEDYSKTLVLGDFVIPTGNVDITDLGDRFRITRNAVAGSTAQSYVDLAVALLTVGDTYFAEFEILATGASNNAYTGATHGGGGTFIGNSYTTGNAVRNAFSVATGAGTGGLRPFFSVSRGSNPSSSIDGDWIEIAKTVTLVFADANRSVNNNGLIVNGTVTRTPVADGADLVAYSGFSASNYLEQPYNSALDFGTGDFCIMGWVKVLSASFQGLVEKTGTSGGIRLVHDTNGVRFQLTDDGFASATEINSGGANLGTYAFYTCIRRSGVIEVYKNGDLKNTTISTKNVTDVASTLIIGKRSDGYPSDGSLALLRISATAPSAEQIAKIYNDEKVLFQENAQATLYGTSDAVTALAHDSDTNLLHVGTSAGRSVFQGLRRVSNTTTAVGTAISAANNMIVEQ